MYKKGHTKQYLHLDTRLCSCLLLDLYTPTPVKQVHYDQLTHFVPSSMKYRAMIATQSLRLKGDFLPRHC